MSRLVRQYISGVFVYAIGAGLAEDDPAHAIRSALKPAIKGRCPAALKVPEAQKVITTIDARPDVSITTKLASRLLALTAARPGVVPAAERSEFEDLDGEEPIWRVPAAKMKLSRERKGDVSWEFIIPLSRQAVETVKLAMKLAGRRRHLFPSARSTAEHMGNNALNVLYRRAGFQDKHVPHGWRSTFSTIMNEKASREGKREDRAIIDLMLAHVPEGVEAAYNRAAFMPRRRELAQEWADLLMKVSRRRPSCCSATERKHTGARMTTRAFGDLAAQLHDQLAPAGTKKIRRTDQPVRRNSFHIGEREREVWRPIADGTSRGARRWIGAMMQALGHVGLEVLRELLRLVDYKTGALFPAIETIARNIKRSRAAVVAALRRLKDNGFLTWIRRAEPTDNVGGYGPRSARSRTPTASTSRSCPNMPLI